MPATQTLADGRYELRERVSADSGSGYWRAFDHVLARDVGIRVMGASPSSRSAAAGARRAAAAVDPRLLQVLDVLEGDDGVAVVSEWAPGRSLETVLLTDGPLPPRTAWQVTAELTAALTAAAAHGLRHGALRPGSVVLTEAGTVKILGVGVDAALAGRDTGERADVLGIGRILYACLTARWPLVHGPSVPSRLRGAPSSDGPIASPRQVRAGVPAVLDDLAARAIGLPPRPPLPTLAALSYALSTAAARLGDVTDIVGDRAVLLDPTASPAAPIVAEEPPPPRRWLAIVIGVLMLAVLGLLAWQLATAAFDSAPAPAVGPSGGATSTGAAAPDRTLKPTRVLDFDPTATGGNGSENPGLVAAAVDGKPTTAWRTMSYRRRPDLGGLKPGVGLVLDLGAEHAVTTVRVTLLGSPTTVELGAAPRDRDASVPSQLVDFRLLATRTTSTSPATVALSPPGPLTTRYLLVWLTRLPPDGPDSYRGRVAEIVVTGR